MIYDIVKTLDCTRIPYGQSIHVWSLVLTVSLRRIKQAPQQQFCFNFYILSVVSLGSSE